MNGLRALADVVGGALPRFKAGRPARGMTYASIRAAPGLRASALHGPLASAGDPERAPLGESSRPGTGDWKAIATWNVASTRQSPSGFALGIQPFNPFNIDGVVP